MNSKYLISILFFILSFTGVLQAQTIIEGFSASNISAGWELPVGVAFSKTGEQFFVWEKAGKVFVCNWNSSSKTYEKQTTPVIDISEEVGNWRDMGLLGFALDPHFDQNGFIYLMYCVDGHHLRHFGTSEYNENTNEYLSATIGRITRYATFINPIGLRVADLSSRKILLGESKSTGVPILYESHGVGTLAFAMDGTLLASTGDGASYVKTDTGNDPDSYFAKALADSIIRENENVGAYRSQMLNSHSGKILRIDPSTGDGVPSNPYYDPLQPRTAKSRVWALGLRNPFRFSIRPFSGSTDPLLGDVGEIFVSDVGYNSFEEVTVIRSPGSNCGWPLYEGLIFDEDFSGQNMENRDEPNPLFANGSCARPYFTFRQLLRQANPQKSSIVYNPCDTSKPIVSNNNNRFLHLPPLLDWQHGFDIARTGIFSGDTFSAAVIGSPESHVTGVPFRGNAASGNLWYTGNAFPPSYKNTLFISDFGANWIKKVELDYLAKPKRVDNFAFDFIGIVDMAENPMDGSIFCVDIGAQMVKRIAFVSNRPPIAKIEVDKYFGSSPVNVAFNSGGSYDPEGMPLKYEWDFGDSSMHSSESNPVHTFSSVNGRPKKFVVKLKVSDSENAVAIDSVIISVNNTPPKVNIISPARNWFYSVGTDTSLPLLAEVNDLEQPAESLNYRWQTILRHNNHEHPDPVDTNKTTTSVISRIGCNGESFHWVIRLSVTDGHGLTTYDSVKLFPACASSLPIITLQPESKETCEGTFVTFKTSTNDNYVLPVEWQVSRKAGDSWQTIPGATLPVLTIKSDRSDSGSSYRAIWYNNKGYAYSAIAGLKVYGIPPKPSGKDTLRFCFSASVADLVIDAVSPKWYSSVTASDPLSQQSFITDGAVYYASQIMNGCESKDRLAVQVFQTDAVHPSFILNGSKSTGKASRYQWELVSGPNIPVIDSPNSIITTVRGLTTGAYHFRLSLDTAVSYSDVIVVVNGVDTTLKAQAGFDRSIIIPDNAVRLDASASTGDIQSYHWSGISGNSSFNFSSPDSISTYVNGLAAGVYAIELLVRGRSGNSKRDTVQINVIPASDEGESPYIVAIDTSFGLGAAAVSHLSGLPTGSLLVLTLAQSNTVSTVFTNSQVQQPDPQEVYNDGFPIEIGMKFKSSEDGYVAGVRFFKASGNTGTHIGELYTADGIRLAQATFMNESASGWQQVEFEKPVRIQKNITYVVAYYSALGNYSAATDFFTASVVEEPLTALASGIDGANGLYSYTESPKFPSSSYGKSNYWVDAVFISAEPLIRSEPGLVWEKRSASFGKAGSGNAAIYSAIFPRGGNISVSSTWGKGVLSTALYAITGCENQFLGNVADTAGIGGVDISLISSRTNSLLIGVGADRNAVNADSRQYQTGTQESGFHFVPGSYTGYHFRRPVTSINRYSLGISSPTGMAAGIAALEVKGQIRLPLMADAGFNQRLLLAIPPAGDAVQYFCDSGRVRDLKVVGKEVQWYFGESGGTKIDPYVFLKDSVNYYAAQTIRGCESKERLSVKSLVTPTPLPPSIQVKDNCDSSLTLTVTRNGKQTWSTGDTSLSIRVQSSDSIFVYRTVNGCIGNVAFIQVNPVLLKLDAIIDQPICLGDSGYIRLEARGGAGGYVFNTTPSGKVPEGTYLYAVSDASNCTRQLQVVVGIERAFWTGAADSDWHNALNWSNGKVPTGKTHVVIPSAEKMCIVSRSDAEAASIQTINGGMISVENGKRVLVAGNCLNLPSVQ